jgi:hypothetical protein
LLYKKLRHQFDPELLKKDLVNVPSDAWIQHYRSDHFEGDWAGIPLRSVSGHPEIIHAAPAGNNPDFYKNTIYLEASPYFLEVLNWFKCLVNAYRLLKLGARSQILEHTDSMSMNGEEEWRIHVPVITSPLIEFRIEGYRLEMQAGEIWYADFNKKHSVKNPSGLDRIHLVLDCRPNDWLVKMFGEE